MTEQELVSDFKAKLAEINSSVQQMAERGIRVEWDAINHQQIQWKSSASILNATVIKVL